MYRVREFKDKNYRSIYFKGKTIRIALDPKKPILDLDYPEFYDIKLTGKCFGSCQYCYTDSTQNQEDYEAVKTLSKFFAFMTENERPWQIACLHENTIVPTADGVKEIKDISIGDKVFNEDGNFVSIKNIVKSSKKVINLIGSKGFSVICTKDHIFIDENSNEVRADEALNKKLKIIKKTHCNDDLFFHKGHIIDMSIYGNKNTRVRGIKGGSSGSIITENKVSLMQSMKPANRYIKLDNDIMWLYGLCVAEGSRKSIALNKNERDFAEKAFSIYRNISGLNIECKLYENKKSNGMYLQFQQPKYFKSLFFEEMQIGYGARNKTIKYLYKCDNNLVKHAIIGMFDGDGSYRRRVDHRNGRVYFSATYKTSSKILAYELIDILYRRFGVYASLNYGINKIRFIDDRILKETDYYMIDIYGKDNINPIFEEKFNDLFSDYNSQEASIYSGNKYNNYIKIKEIISDNIIGEVYDISLESDSSHLFSLSHGVITHNCGGGEPTLHYQFHDVMKMTRSFDIAPNYTTNGMFSELKEAWDIVDTTKEYCEGVAVTCHKHLKKYWVKATNMFLAAQVFTNFHILISDTESVLDFVNIFTEWEEYIKYFVLLPMIPHGRASGSSFNIEGAVESLNQIIGQLSEDKQTKIAFGANFYPYIKKGLLNNARLSIYEPEIMSKFIDLKDGSIYKSSFDTGAPIGNIFNK
jgi:hypothetical protein